MATLFRRGKVWWMNAGVAGQRLRWSLDTTDERIARHKLKKFEYEHATGDLTLPSVTPLAPFLQAFCEHLETARSRKAYKNDVSYLRTFFGPVCDALKPKSTLNRDHVPKKPIKVKDKLPRRHVQVATLEDLTPGLIEEHITRRMRLDGIAPKTANRLREVLHVLFNHAIRQHAFRALDRRFPNPVDAVFGAVVNTQDNQHLRDLLDHNVVLEMDGLSSSADRVMFSEALTLYLYRYEVTLEQPVPGDGVVDVVAARPGERIAVEVETGKSDIAANLSKLRGAGFDRVIVLATSPAAVAVCERAIQRLGDASGAELQTWLDVS